jgi:FkbM family methyltransferase
MIQQLRGTLKKFRQRTAPIRHPWRTIQRNRHRADVKSMEPVSSVSQPEGRFHVKEFKIESMPVHAVCRTGTMDEGIFGSVYEEYGMAALFRSLAGRRATVVDIGGHIGGFSVTLASLLPELEAWVYEYVPENYRMIQMNALLNGLERRISVFNRAVSDQTDKLVQSHTFSKEHENTGGVSIACAPHVSAEVDESTVPTIASKDIFAALDHVDVLKIDCEGSEFKILFSLDEKDYRKIDLITGEIHDSRGLHGFETNGHSWKSSELTNFLQRFYKTVTIHKTSPCVWGFLQIFTASDPRE